ncbi:MAG TPA: hypothetical protein VEG32_15480 [Clostridia bacterium]|nr:hypothetical protein [Clostridia bacterium]
MNGNSDVMRIPLARPQSYWPLLLLIAVPVFLILTLLTLRHWRENGSPLIAVLVLLPSAGIVFWLWRQKWDLRDWSTVPILEIRGGRLTALPAPAYNFGLDKAEVAFSPGSRLECRIETGDAFFDNDRAQQLRTTLWMVESSGVHTMLPGDFSGVDPTIAVANLSRAAGIELRIVRVYDGQHGEHEETDVTAEALSRRRWPALKLLAGSSSLWLGCLAGASVRSIGLTAAIGIAAFALIASFELLHSDSKRARVILLATTLPSYAVGYVLAVILARSMVVR